MGSADVRPSLPQLDPIKVYGEGELRKTLSLWYRARSVRIVDGVAKIYGFCRNALELLKAPCRGSVFSPPLARR